jgi:hypothetical protein
VELVDQESDFVITKAAISKALNGKTRSNCHVILPNDADKVSRKTFPYQPSLFGSRGRIVSSKVEYSIY